MAHRGNQAQRKSKNTHTFRIDSCIYKMSNVDSMLIAKFVNMAFFYTTLTGKHLSISTPYWSHLNNRHKVYFVSLNPELASLKWINEPLYRGKKASGKSSLAKCDLEEKTALV
ncbi:hypothetical protein VME_09590 [Vibrio harveyi 1DA3]|nr:hypothetical protein VME_09590 [Vibrio harveyi 1DA3]